MQNEELVEFEKNLRKELQKTNEKRIESEKQDFEKRLESFKESVRKKWENIAKT